MMDVIIVVHTEFGYVKDREVIPDKNATQGVGEAVPNLVKLADTHGAKVTFAVMPEVAGFMPESMDHEIGLHVHAGWEERRKGDCSYYVGDRYLREHCDQSSTSTVLPSFPYREQFEMIKTGADCLEDVLGTRPTTFVAGKWSLNNDTIRALIATGMERDCSAPPHASESHFDWSRLPRICMPYHPSGEDYQKKGDLPLLIVPISRMFRAGNVNPEVVPMYGLPRLKACFSEFYEQGMPLFHICLHSPCMADGYFLAAMDELLRFIGSHQNVAFRFASEIPEYASVRPSTRIWPYLRDNQVVAIGCALLLNRIFR